VRPWYARLGAEASLATLNALAEEAGLRTESGRAVRFVPPAAADPYYEIKVFETGCVQTRAGNLHDLFNALAWLAFPRAKARINAMHAAQIPLEPGRRGRLRDLLTIFDEGGAIVRCADEELRRMIREFRWRELFWECRERVLRSMQIVVVGHAVLEKALAPWPGIACKAMLIGMEDDADACAAQWLSTHGSPQELAALPVFGYPGWLAESSRAEFYGDTRYFRAFRSS